MGGALGFLIIGGVLALWIIAFVRMQKFGGSKGIKQFFLMLLLSIVIGGLLFLIIIVPIMNCGGFLCGLGEILIFLLGCLIVLIAMPIIMMTAMTIKLKRANPSLPKENAIEILDEI